VLNVYWYAAFCPMLLLPHVPSSPLIVCGTESLLVQVTVVPTLTVSVSGEKAKADTVTATVIPGAGIEGV